MREKERESKSVDEKEKVIGGEKKRPQKRYIPQMLHENRLFQHITCRIRQIEHNAFLRQALKRIKRKENRERERESVCI